MSTPSKYSSCSVDICSQVGSPSQCNPAAAPSLQLLRGRSQMILHRIFVLPPRPAVLRRDNRSARMDTPVSLSTKFCSCASNSLHASVSSLRSFIEMSGASSLRAASDTFGQRCASSRDVNRRSWERIGVAYRSEVFFCFLELGYVRYLPFDDCELSRP